MVIIKKLTILTVIVLFLPAYAFAFADGDFQYWNTERISYKINKEWKIGLEEEFRFGNNAGNLYYQHSDIGVSYSGLAEWIDLGINYRLVFEEKNDKWKYENRPHFNATLKYNLDNVKLSDRSRIEYRAKEKASDSWRYRNKFTIKIPLKVGEVEINPYIADEIFLDCAEGEFNKNRLYSGIYLNLLKNLGADVFYMWQLNKTANHWTTYNILGTKVKLSF